MGKTNATFLLVNTVETGSAFQSIKMDLRYERGILILGGIIAGGFLSVNE